MVNKKRQLVIHIVTFKADIIVRMIVVSNYGCVKYTLYKCNLKIMVFESIFL